MINTQNVVFRTRVAYVYVFKPHPYSRFRYRKRGWSSIASGCLHTFQIIAGNEQRMSTANTHDGAPTNDSFRITPFLHCLQGKRVDQPVEKCNDLREKRSTVSASDIVTLNSRGSWSKSAAKSDQLVKMFADRTVQFTVVSQQAGKRRSCHVA
jgi:hypothetical protein